MQAFTLIIKTSPHPDLCFTNKLWRSSVIAGQCWFVRCTVEERVCEEMQKHVIMLREAFSLTGALGTRRAHRVQRCLSQQCGSAHILQLQLYVLHLG